MNMCECNCQGPKSDFSLLDEALEMYGDSASNLITILQKAQESYGYLPKDVMYYIADKVGVTPAEVVGVATFYSQFRLTPIGKYLMMSCQGTACHVNGSERVLAAVSEYLGIENGETTEDGLFTLENVACLGCCSLAPVMMINGEAYGNLTPDSAVAVIKQLQKKSGENSY
jgi:NADH-quinone oxidoreductase subunit E